MKTMTCRQLGGPCDLKLSADSADEMIKAQDQHLKDAIRRGDTTHEDAASEMRGRWKHPKKALGWYLESKRTFAALAAD